MFSIHLIHQCTPKTVASTLKKAYKKLCGYLNETDYYADTDFEAIGSSKMNDMNAAVNVRKNASGREPSKNQK